VLASSAVADPFARYTTPGQCQQAVVRLQRRYWRDKRPDTVVYAPATDSVPTPVVKAARRCATRFAVATVPVPELQNLAQLYLWTGQDSLADQAMTRLQQSTRSWSARERGWVLSLWVNAALDARPMRRVLVQSMLAQLDSFGAPAATWRLFAHAYYAEYALSVNDRATAESEGRAALRASRQMTMDDRIDWVWQIGGAYRTVARVVALTRGETAALALLDSMRIDLTPLRPLGTADRAQLVAQLIEWRTTPFTWLGRAAWPAVRAAGWYGASGDTVYPRAGRLSLLVFAYGADYRMLAMLRRLHDAYSAQGLDIVVLTSTHGYFRAMPMLSSAVEMDSLGSYFHGYLHLPATVAVEITEFSHLADGRRRDEETPNQKAFGHVGGAMLIDRHGVARWIGDVNPQTEAVWTAVIRDAR